MPEPSGSRGWVVRPLEKVGSVAALSHRRAFVHVLVESIGDKGRLDQINASYR